MPEYKYLIVGGGMTADAAAHGIREVDRKGSIGVIGAEPHPPYDRPPLTKGLWKDKSPESIWRKSNDVGATWHRGRRATLLDPRNKRVTDDQGTVHSYERLLLATGATPRRLPFDSGESVIYYRRLDDYRRLRALTETHKKFAVIGGGFIGSEIAAALAMNGRDVVMLFPDEAIGGKVFPPDLALFLNRYYREKGVEVLAGASVVGVEGTRDKPALKIRDSSGKGQSIAADGIVAGLGVEPNVDLAEAAGLRVENGIRVDATLRTSYPDIYAAGDVASFHNPAVDKWLRVEHEDNANTMGGAAGRSMAGAAVSYDHLPMFYSDLFDLGYEAVGEIDPRLETVEDWKTPFREGVVYYLRAGRVKGVLLWNVWEKVDAARKLIAEPGPFKHADLKGRLL